MKHLAFLLLLIATAAAAPAPKEEVVEIFDHRKIVIPVPAGFTLLKGNDAGGGIGLRLGKPDGSLDVQISFVRDADGELNASARSRKELMVRAYQEFVADSTEQAMQFEDMETKVGAGTYCVFTDAKLVGQPKVPPGEFIYVTAGIRVWRGMGVIFKIFGNDLRSDDYREVMKLLRDGLRERPLTPLL